jgi:hypothetical protein
MAEESFRWEAHPEGHVKFEVPTSWTKREGDSAMLVTSPDGVSIEFRYFNLGAVEALHDEKVLTKELEGKAQDIKITNGPNKFTQHGLAGFGVGGTGQQQGRPICWALCTLGDRQGHGVLALGFGPEAQWVAQLQSFLRTVGSIQPLPAAQ